MKQLIFIFCLFGNSIMAQIIDFNEKYGFYQERKDSTLTFSQNYNDDNVTFLPNTSFVYNYQIIKDGKSLKVKFKIYQNWDYVADNDIDTNTVYKIQLFVKKEKGIFPDQTIIKYNYLNKDKKPLNSGNDGTGAIENKKNIWIHPPRQSYFMITEMNPFPFVMLPYEQDKNYVASLTYHSNLVSDSRWKVWEGYNLDKRNYKITGKKILKTPLGDIECTEIISTCTSPLGKTSLNAYFHEKYGFVKLEYTNIDQSKLILNLVEYAHR
jgi:hypothetical protein